MNLNGHEIEMRKKCMKGVGNFSELVCFRNHVKRKELIK